MIRWNTGRLFAPEGDASPAIAPVPAAPAVTPPAAPPAKVVTVDDLPPEALKQRLEQAERAGQTKLLESLGITDPEQAKAAIAAARALEEAKKTNEQRLAEQNVELTSLKTAVDSAIAQAALTLTPERKAEIDAVAGNDKALWLKIYGLEKKPAAPAAAATVPAPGVAPIVPPAAPAAPAGTAPVAPAPAPAGTVPGSPPDHKTIYASLVKANPFAASRYLDKHGDACFK